MIKSINVNKVLYKDFEKNALNVEWTGWKDLLAIERILKPSKHYSDPCAHMYCFLNNYWLEEAVKNEFGFEYIGKDHEAIYPYNGKNVCDFIDNDGTIYELKQGFHIEYADKIPARDWHDDRAVKLFYDRSARTLYEKRREDYCWNPIAQLSPKRINPLNGLKAEEVIKFHKLFIFK